MAWNRRSTVLGIVLLLAVSAAGVVVAFQLWLGGYIPLVSEGRVAIIPIQGIIDSDRAVLRTLDRYRDDSSVRAFVLEISSPGGGVGPSQSIYSELRKLREEDNRPLIAWIGSVGASGGYYVALPADSIFALPGSITGSIGVIMQFANAEGLLDKVGIGLEVVKSGQFKDTGSPARPLSDEEREILQEVIHDTYGQFVDAITDSRGMEREAVLEVADGRILSGERAMSVGLIDRLGTLPDAIAAAGEMAGLGSDPKTLRPTQRRATWIDLIGQIPGLRWMEFLGRLDESGALTPSLRYQWQ
ncbi:MAG: signal peptide peptidase SppA [Gemmatimonadota bacterium]